jgi:hypothetical protein
MSIMYCPKCGNQLNDPDIRFCPSCGSPIVDSKIQESSSESLTDLGLVKPKLKIPAISIMVNAGISILLCLFSVIVMDAAQNNGYNGGILVAVGKTFFILLLPLLTFSIYGAFLMMTARKHGFAITSAIITIASGIIGPLSFTGIAIGIWVLIILLKPATKAAFADISRTHGKNNF